MSKTEVFVKIGEIEGHVWEGVTELLKGPNEFDEVIFRERGEYHVVSPFALSDAFKRQSTG